MIKPPEHHVYFSVTDFGNDPNVVTQAMGVQPTQAWVRGDVFGNGKRTHSRWTLQSRLPLYESIERHVEDVLAQLASLADAVRTVSRVFQARLTIAAYWQSVNPTFSLRPPALHQIAALGLEIDFDLYCLGPDTVD